MEVMHVYCTHCLLLLFAVCRRFHETLDTCALFLWHRLRPSDTHHWQVMFARLLSAFRVLLVYYIFDNEKHEFELKILLIRVTCITCHSALIAGFPHAVNMFETVHTVHCLFLFVLEALNFQASCPFVRQINISLLNSMELLVFITNYSHNTPNSFCGKKRDWYFSHFSKMQLFWFLVGLLLLARRCESSD